MKQNYVTVTLCIDDDAQCSYAVHTLDALLRGSELNCFSSVTARLKDNFL